MNVYLLYADTDRLDAPAYFDGKSIAQDLGLKALFLSAAKEVIYDKDRVVRVGKEDLYILDAMRKVMQIPLRTPEEIRFRQEALSDFLENEELIRGLYRISSLVLSEWNKLGRGVQDKIGSGDSAAKLLSEVKTVNLFAVHLREIRDLLEGCLENLRSEALRSLYERLKEEYSPEREQYVTKILGDVSFFTEGLGEEEAAERTIKPRIVFECGVEDGLKLSSLRLQDVSSESVKFYRPGSAMDRLQEFKNSRIPDSFSTVKEPAVKEQAGLLEYEVVSYLVRSLDPFMAAFHSFFDALHIQSAFYLGAVNLRHHMKRFGLTACFPEVCAKDRLSFRNLKEFVMCLEQRVDAVGNTCDMDHRMLLIVTGANQGGKSTFLRSVGVAQVMMQSGLMVTAERFESGIFPELFTHFTRREDSEMNSGRLDEELRRMSRIVDQVGDRSLILLNESFATTTEKEGSVIAYDIIKALKERGVKILTVTHLLSFAQRMYQESGEKPDTDVEFLSAERKTDGTRTFKMIQHAPELTSFGLDLYEEIVEGNRSEGQ